MINRIQGVKGRGIAIVQNREKDFNNPSTNFLFLCLQIKQTKYKVLTTDLFELLAGRFLLNFGQSQGSYSPSYSVYAKLG